MSQSGRPSVFLLLDICLPRTFGGSDDVCSDDVCSDYVRADYVRADYVRTDYVRTDYVRSIVGVRFSHIGS